MENGSERCQSW